MRVSQAAGDDARMPADHDRDPRAVVAASVLYSEDATAPTSPAWRRGQPRVSRLSHMTTSVGVHEAKTHLSRLLEKVAAGEEVEITNRGKVVARLVGPARRTPNFDFDRGNVWIADDFDELPEDLQRAFEGEE